MIAVGNEYYWSRAELADHLTALGLRKGDSVMVHTAMRTVGSCLNGADDVIAALLQVIGDNGTVLCYINWLENYEDSTDAAGRVPEALKPLIAPFDVSRSRASPDHGIFAECFRTRANVLRSANPGASVAAVGAKSTYFTENHSLLYGYGEDSPFGRLVAENGKVLMLGAPADTMSLLHHAESIAPLKDKRLRFKKLPLYQAGGHVRWVMCEEFDTVDSVCDCFPDGYFAAVVVDFCREMTDARHGKVGSADSLLVSARPMCGFAVRWMTDYQQNSYSAK